MSHAGRRRPRSRLGARLAAVLTALTLTAAVAVPAAIAPDGTPPGERAVRGAAAGAPLAAPVDQIRAREWHLNAMRVPLAWKWSKGAEVTIAVLDTGVDSKHPDLSGRVISGPDLTGSTRRPGGRFWGQHGTSMASIIAGHGNGPGLQRGVVGVAPMSNILSIRVTWENDDPLRRSGGQIGRNRDAVAQGIRYAVDHGADIINMSLGGGKQFYDGSSTEAAAIKYALSKGVVLIASAGNDGSSANRKNFPAAYPGVIAVGALDRRMRLWKDSNRRPYVAVCAPGVDIVSADVGSGYIIGTGTSPASAMVTGVVALIRARYGRLTPEEIRQALVQGSPARRRPTGSANCAGPLDAVRAVAAAAKINKAAHGPGAVPRPTAPAAAPVSEPAEDDSSHMLLIAVLAGGGVLVAVGLLLGFVQRRRPGDEDDGEPFGEVSDYGLPAAPREPVAAMAPVNAPLWQSTEVSAAGFAEDSPAAPHPGAAMPGPPPPAAWPPAAQPPAAQPPSAQPPSAQPPAEYPPSPGRQSELRPYVPDEAPAFGHNGHGSSAGGEYSNGKHYAFPADPGRVDTPGEGIGAHRAPEDTGFGAPNGSGGLNGGAAGALNGGGLNGGGDFNGGDDFNGGNGLNGLNGGDGLNGSGGLNGDPLDDGGTFDDEEWERFRRTALEGSSIPESDGGTFTFPVVPQEPAATEQPPPAVPPAVPPVPPTVDPLQDDPLGRPSRRPRPSEEDDFRPPWW